MSLEALYATALLIMHLHTLFHSPCITVVHLLYTQFHSLCICTHSLHSPCIYTHGFIHFALLLNIYCCAFVHLLCIHHAFIHTLSFAVHLYIHTLGFLVESGDYGGPS